MKKYAFWALLAVFLVFAGASWAEQTAPAGKPAGQGMQKVPSGKTLALIRHANPMPNLMMTVMRHQAELGLSEEQKKALMDWHKQMHPQMLKMVKMVADLEQQIHDAALAGASGAVLQDLAMQLFNVRGAIIKQKLACRNNMARVLGMEKMKKVIELYRKDQAAASRQPTGV